MGVAPGDIVQNPRWPEPVEVKLVESMGDYMRLVGVTVRSRQHNDQLIAYSEFDSLEAARQICNFQGNPRQVFLAPPRA